jgi:hypothetical protein
VIFNKLEACRETEHISDPEDPPLLESDRNRVVSDLTDFGRILIKTARSEPCMWTCGSIFHSYRIPSGRIVGYTAVILGRCSARQKHRAGLSLGRTAPLRVSVMLLADAFRRDC